MAKILGLIGDYYHPADYIREGLIPLLKKDGMDYTLEEDENKIPWDKLHEFDLFILFKAGKIEPEESDRIWMETFHQQHIHDFVQKGGALIVIHSGLADYPVEGPFRQMVKGHFLHHPDKHPVIRIRQLNEKPHIVKGVREFEITDEQYFVSCDKGDVDCLFAGISEEYGSAIAGWAHQFGKGRVFCFTPGHTLEVLGHPVVQKIIGQGIDWCLS